MLLFKKLISTSLTSKDKSSISDYNNCITILNNLLAGNLPSNETNKIDLASFSSTVQEKFAKRIDHLLPILVDVILQGKTANPLFGQQISSRITAESEVNNYIPATDRLFSIFCVRNPGSINDFLNGDLSSESFQEILDQLKTHTEKNPHNYYRFLLINFIDSYALNFDVLNDKILNYYQYLFKNIEKFQQNNLKLFSENLPVPSSRVMRLNGNLRPFRVSPDFEQLNTYNLANLTAELTAEQTEKLLNYLCKLTKQPRAEDKDIIFNYENNNNLEYQQAITETLSDQLNVYTDSDFLNITDQTFLGYPFYFDDSEGYIEIILDNSLDI